MCRVPWSADSAPICFANGGLASHIYVIKGWIHPGVIHYEATCRIALTRSHRPGVIYLIGSMGNGGGIFCESGVMVRDEWLAN